MKERIVYMVSGHRDLTQEEFNRHYQDRILEALAWSGSDFVLGDAPGADKMAQELLLEHLDPGSVRVRVFHIGDSPRFNVGAFPSIKVDGTDQFVKDSAMTMLSDLDILWVRKRNGGTYENQIRRILKDLNHHQKQTLEQWS